MMHVLLNQIYFLQSQFQKGLFMDLSTPLKSDIKCLYNTSFYLIVKVLFLIKSLVTLSIKKSFNTYPTNETLH